MDQNALWSVELQMVKTPDGNFTADISGLSDEDKRILVESLRAMDGEEDE